MSPLTFLLIAVVVGLVGTLVAVIVHRQPSRPDAAMDDFAREMRALAPRPEADRHTAPGSPASPDSPGAPRPDIGSDES